MNTYEQRFFSTMQDTFTGHRTEGKSGYANLLDLKNKYFSQIEPYIKTEIEKKIEEPAREELYQKLYTFFDAYLNETGTVFFAKTHIHKNIYEKIYDDRNDVMLFWKTKQLYYVKTEAFYDNLETEVGTTTFMFDASELKHKKANEKKELAFYLTEVQKDKVKFKVRYKTNNDFSRLKEILELDKNNDIIDYLLDNYGSNENPEIIYSPTTLNRDFFTKKGDKRKNLYIELQDDLQKSVKVEYSISDFNLIFNYLTGNQIIIDEDDLKKAFAQYKRQKEVDYFIHKNAEAFLKEQFDIYMYNWLFNDTKSQFDEATVKRMQNIKIIAYKIIEYIARFEYELKAIWQKPKFVRKSNYVITIDKLNDKLIKKIEKHTNLKDQINEWQELGFIDNDFNFENIYETDLTGKHLTEKYKHLPIDTKYFKDIEYEILDIFEHLDQSLDGVLIKSDNWQALNTIKEKFKERIQTIYIDPPFNTGDDFDYVDKFQDSTWLTLMENRLTLSRQFLLRSGIISLHLDFNANYYGRFLLNEIYKKNNFSNEIIWYYTNKIPDTRKKSFTNSFDTIMIYSKNYEKKFFNWLYEKREKPIKVSKMKKENGKKIYLKDENGKGIYEIREERTMDNVWKIPLLHAQSEIVNFKTQKPEELLKRVILSHSSKFNLILDFFVGSGTTIAVAHKLNRKWIGVEMGEHIYSVILPRMKSVLFGVISGISNELEKEKKLNKGGFFKYYELEQYEEVLAKAQYQWHEKDSEVEKYTFMQDQKLLEAIEIDYEKKNTKLVFEKLYDDIDLAETFSNLLGKSIKKMAKDYCILTDHDGNNEMKIDYNNLTFEKYPFVKPLIWWQSK